jgi:hypothetical protein
MPKVSVKMTDSPIPPTGQSSSSSGGASSAEGPSGSLYYQAGGGWKSYEEWMGEKTYKQFMNNLLQGIVTQIGNQKEKEHETAMELQRAEKGEDMYE